MHNPHQNASFVLALALCISAEAALSLLAGNLNLVCSDFRNDVPRPSCWPCRQHRSDMTATSVQQHNQSWQGPCLLAYKTFDGGILTRQVLVMSCKLSSGSSQSNLCVSQFRVRLSKNNCPPALMQCHAFCWGDVVPLSNAHHVSG